MKKAAAILLALMLAACTHTQGQNTYNYNEVGQSKIVEFATVIRVKPVNINGQNTGAGAVAGATAGGVTGYQFGGGNGQVATTVAGAFLGGVAGHLAEQEMANKKGFAYTVVTEEKKTKEITQYQNDEDVVFKPGDRVMIETSGTYQRVLPTDNLPDTVKKPKGIKVVD